MPKTLFVCTSCDRNASMAADKPSAGAALATVIASAVSKRDNTDLVVRKVACLNGCLRPCNVAFRGNNRYTYRFSRLEPEDVPALLAFGSLYWAAPEGAVEPAQIPLRLRAKLTVHTPPRGRW